MTIGEKIARSNFIIKLKSWEYWPFGIIQLPVFFYFAWLSLRSRSLIFFSASNPGIVMGGMFGESKYDVLKKIPPVYVPKTIIIRQPTNGHHILQQLSENGFKFPVIFKPDIGERGFMVKRIGSDQDMDQYLSQMKFDFLVQDLVDAPLEFGIFYTRFPNRPTGKITSIVMKELLTVTGDGQSTLEQLILNKDRAKLQWHKLSKVFQDKLSTIIPNGEVIELVPIGNHCLGTKFLDGSHLINDRLSATFDAISKQIDGFYFGRFDLRCATVEDLYAGRVQIMELNGCGAEPAHIYQPGYSLSKAVAVLLEHWRNIFLIARENALRGNSYTSFKEARIYYRRFKEATQLP